jgi:hypothetical protein
MLKQVMNLREHGELLVNLEKKMYAYLMHITCLLL